MSEEKNAPTKESLEKSLSRLRKRITYVQDEMDITAFAIRAIERDLQQIETEDKEANETNA
jgi:predicted  nucleic acid-binding Zn-ribbon protein